MARPLNSSSVRCRFFCATTPRRLQTCHTVCRDGLWCCRLTERSGMMRITRDFRPSGKPKWLGCSTAALMVCDACWVEQFELPIAVIRAKAEWLKEANPLTSFVDECCSREDPLGKCLLKDFYGSYRHWAQERGYTKTQQYQTVKRNLENLGFPNKRSNEGVVILGLTLGGAR